jgi:hypothetical protein
MIRSALQLWSDLRDRSGARIAIGLAIGVLGMALGVVLQAGRLFKQPASGDPRLVLAEAKLAERPGQADVGHLRYTVTGAQIQRVADPEDGDESRLLARISVRIADQKGISDYIDNETFRLVVDGEALSHSNNVNVTIYEHASAEAELVFELPEEVSTAQLLVRRGNEGSARIPVVLSPRRMAEGLSH